ncbi:putative nuclease HARBI1 [Rhopalosiphum padi]|uniref:putative nuclease HARBI1 n=1 Tax=Rhopalosiphum padi TaxID=40932 RepID=UPI00298E260A|nr:putative nuclease HARBI1 [Rhopalosiphum padi]
MVLEELLDQIKYPTNRNNAISPMTQLLLTLRFFATGNFLITAGDFSGVSIAAAGQIVKRVSYALAIKSDKYIKMPKATAEIMKVKVMFYGLARFPKVIGAIDCTHIKLQSPSREYGEQYRNRKGYFSLNLQALVNANLEFLDVVARWPGSAHDSNIFANSRLRARMELHEFKDCVILGDAGYAFSHYLLTPIANPTTRAERLYNESQIRTRNVVERTFGVWKRRFPVLFFGLRLKMETSMAVIQSCAILHNIARLANDPQPPDEVENIN